MKLPSPPQPNQTPLNAADLDEDVVQTVREMVDVLLSGSDTPLPAATTEAEKAKLEARSTSRLRTYFKLPRGWRIIGQAAGWLLWLSVLWLFAGLIAALGSEGRSGWVTVLYPLLPLAVGWAGVVGIGKKQKRWQKEQALAPATLLRVLPLFPRENIMQAAYCDAVSALLKQQAAWGTSTTQNVLLDLKSLLQNGKQAAARRAEIEQAMSHQSVADMEAESARLADHAENATDETARETYKQSLALLEARLNRAKSLEPLRQQLEAQEEVITQALFEAQSALSGASLAHWAFVPPNAPTTKTNVPGVPLAHLGDTVARLRQQTEAVEQAVREVMVVGAGTGR